MVNRDQVLDALRTVNDPELHRDIVTLNMVKGVDVHGGRVALKVELTTPACPLKDQITRDVKAAVMRLDGVEQVDVEFSAQVRGPAKPRVQLPGVKNIVAVGAGKGGVGKSTVAVLLAVGLRREGATVGLLDADVYGPSIPTMMGVRGMRPDIIGEESENPKLVPLVSAGVKLMSIGSIIDPDQAVVWRGPMVHGALQQFIGQVDWGDLDYLIVDLPPGTGDVPLTLSQSIPCTGSVVVCTPQDVALIDARRALRMYQQLNVPSLGIVENMSYYLCPKCGHRDEIFDHGGAAAAAKELGVPFLGEIPLNVSLRVFSDEGAPEKQFTKTDAHVREAIEKVVRNVAGQISVRNMLQVARPTVTIE